jgi:sterol desaturase/sphingolipid hydroxylase (fatty acid hydroxylase superfamily)
VTFDSLITSLVAPFGALVHPRFPLSVYYLGGTLLFLLAVVAVYHLRRNRRSLRGFWRVALPKRLYLSASARLDYRFYVVNGVFGALVYGSLIATASLFHDLTVSGLAGAFGPAARTGGPDWMLTAATTVAAILALDFGYWLGHWMQHKSPFLWEFHKVHHSAEIMTPFTTWRQHPVEDFFMGNVMAVPMGGVHGALVYAFGPEAQALSLWEVNVLLLPYYVTFFHLRHSHVWMPVGGWLGRIVHSPAHHQIHHSDDPRHLNKNMGYVLSVWDWAFGTLYVPEKREPIRFGIGAESPAYSSCWRLYALPFANLWRRSRPKRRAAEPA